MNATEKELGDAAKKLKEMSPAPMNSMLQKELKANAKEKKNKKMSLVVEDVAPTTPGATMFVILYVYLQ